jgi:hypothetical protein
MDTEGTSIAKVPWNKVNLVGQKAPLKLKDIRAIRIRLPAKAATWKSGRYSHLYF